MSINTTNITKGPLVLVTQQNGVTVIPQPTPLTRLNYFDGKFLRASDLSAEQLYLRRLVDLSNQAGGPGVVHGYNLSLTAGGDTLNLGPGLAIDPQGRVLLLPVPFSIGVQDLIDKSRQLKITPSNASAGNGNFADCTVVTETPPGSVVQAGNLYLITVGFAEALCGQEDVFGKLCEEACVTSTDRPYLVEGVILRAIPLQLQTLLPTSAVVALSQLHLRSRVASSYFEDERNKVASFISGDGLRSDVWCFGAEAVDGLDVPIGVIARAGNTTLFLDAWTARRERIDTPAKRYWQWRMAMRPWDVFLAQILQFQCQLSGLFKTTPEVGGGDDPCASTRSVLREASETVAKVASYYQAITERLASQPLLLSGNASADKPPTLDLIALLDFQKRLQAVNAATVIPGDRILIDGGIIELPSAGYLPVTPSSVVTVNEQVRRLLGHGVNLRFCVVRPDFVAHALEEAQHMERISLLKGLDNTNEKPQVDILVPDGVILRGKVSPTAELYAAEIRASARQTGGLVAKGTGREETLAGGGTAVYSAGVGVGQQFVTNLSSILRASQLYVKPVAKFGIKNTGIVAEGLTPNFDTNVFLQSDPLTTAQFVARLSETLDASSQFARARSMAGLVRGVTTEQTETPDDSTNGYWLTFRSERSIKGLKQYEQTQVSGRAILAHFSNAPLAVEAEFHGPLTIIGIDLAATGSGPVVTATANLTVTVKVAATLDTDPSRPGKETETDLVVTILLNLGLQFAYEGNDADGSVTLGLLDSAGKPFSLWVKKSYRSATSWILYELFLSNKRKLGELQFTGDNDVARPANPDHRRAINGLDLIQAALVLTEPAFRKTAEAELFPALPPATEEITIAAKWDWVLFHRRRTKQCATVYEAPQAKPPRSYRILHIDGKSESYASDVYGENFKNRLAAYLPRLLKDGLDLVVSFAADTADPLYDAATVASTWQEFKPGGVILYVAYGSIGDDDVLLQTDRLHRFETAIRDASRETLATRHASLAPFPSDLLPPDADGIMLFITVNVEKTELVYPVGFDNSQVVKNVSFAKVLMRNNEPQGTELDTLVARLKSHIDTSQQNDPNPILGVRYIWVGSTSASDAAAESRGWAIRGKLLDAGLAINAEQGNEVQVVSLSQQQKDGTKGRFGATVLDGVSDEILLEYVRDWKQIPTTAVKLEDAVYRAANQTMRMTLTVTNNGDAPIRLGEFYSASARFLDSSVAKIDASYPEDLLAQKGLAVSDNSPVSPGETRTVEALVSGTAWAVPDPSFAGALVFSGADGNRQIVPIVPNPVPEGGISPQPEAGSARIVLLERNASGLVVMTDPALDIQFNAADKLDDDKLPEAAVAWLTNNVSAHSLTFSAIYLVGDAVTAGRPSEQRINSLRNALGIELELLDPETIDAVMTPADAQSQFGNYAAQILLHLTTPSAVQELVVLEADR